MEQKFPWLLNRKFIYTIKINDVRSNEHTKQKKRTKKKKTKKYEDKLTVK